MKDFLLDADGDLDLTGADLNIGVSDLQQQELIIISQKGALKDFPERGVGIENYINESEIEEMVTEVKAEFTNDGMAVEKINYNEADGNLDYTANY